MPRKMPSGLMALLARKDKEVESHTTLQVLIDNGDILRNFYFASAELVIKESTYAPLLKQASQIKSSITQAADKATVELNNADTEIGQEFLALGQNLYGAEMKVGRYWRDLVSGSEYHKIFLVGPLIGLEIDQDVAKITAVSEPYANISVGASRRVTNLCQWIFRDPTTCGYAGSLLTCNFMLNNSGGCDGRHGTPLKQAKFGGDAYLSGGSRLKTL